MYLPGYPKLSAFVLSEPANKLMIYRRFAYLQTRLLLQKQERLSSLERKLRLFDREEFHSNPEILKSRSTDEEHARRQALFMEIENNLMGYHILELLSEALPY